MKKKRNLLIIVACLIAGTLNAQTEAGKILVGGSTSLGFDAVTYKYKSDDGDGTDGKGINFNLSPEAGYFVMDGLAVGLAFDFSVSTFKADGTEFKNSASTVVASPFVKYYYGTSNIKPFASASIGFGGITFKDKFDETTETEKTGVFGFGLGVGAAMFMNDNVAFELGVGFNSASLKEKDDNDNNYRDITSNVGFQVGVVVVL